VLALIPMITDHKYNLYNWY